MVRRFLALGLAVLLPAMLAACGQLPRPFQPEGKGLDLRSLGEQDTIYVAPLAGDRPFDESGLRAALASELIAQGLPATALDDPNWHGRRLSGTARLSPAAPDREVVEIDWRVSDRHGSTLAQRGQRLELAAGAWREGLGEQQRELAAAAARSLSQPLLGEAPRQVTQARPHVVLVGVEGAPGDGGRSLPRALTQALRGAAVRLASVPAAGDLLLSGSAALTPPEDGWQTLSLTWTVRRADDGSEVGTISQGGRIPAGSLDGPWGATANDIAAGATDGILSLLTQVTR